MKMYFFISLIIAVTASQAAVLDREEACFDVKTVTTSWGGEIEWTIGCSDGPCAECASETAYVDHAEYGQECCFPKDQEEFVITCKDTEGDGWHNGYIEIRGDIFCQNFREGLEYTDKLKSGDNTGSDNAQCEDSNNGATDEDEDDCAFYNDPKAPEHYCGEYDDDDFTAKSMCCGCKPAGSGQISEIQCRENERKVTITLTTKEYGYEIQWSLSENCTSEYTYDDYYNGKGYEDDQNYTSYCCLTDGVYNLKCMDIVGDGWHGGYLTIDGAIFCEDFVDDVSGDGVYDDSETTVEVKIGGQ